MVISHYFPSRLSLSVAETGRKTLFCRNAVAFLPFLASNYLNILWLIIFFFLIPRRMCHENIILRLLISKTFFLNSSMSKIQCKILSGEGGIAAVVEKPLVWFWALSWGDVGCQKSGWYPALLQYLYLFLKMSASRCQTSLWTPWPGFTRREIMTRKLQGNLGLNLKSP